MCRVSVLVPVYKAEKYIRRCLDSLLGQTLKDFELILVDDGSPDCSGAICDEYSKKDSRVRVIHKINGGVSSARQAGLDVAVGEYVIHADPDDWVEADMLEELYRKAVEADADMVFCDFYQDYANGRSIYVSQKIEDPIDSQTVLVNLLEGKIHGSCCNKLIKTQTIASTNAKFPVDVIRWEDLWFNMLVLQSNVKVFYLQKAFYHYDQFSNDNSIVRKIRKEAVESQIKFCKYFSALFSEDFLLANGLYQCKARTIELMFFSLLYSKEEILGIFSEINERYVSENNAFSLKRIEPFLLSELLEGHNSFACVSNYVYVKLFFPINEYLKAALWKLSK